VHFFDEKNVPARTSEDSFFSCVFRGNFSQERGFGIPVPAKSCWLWPATKEGSLLSKIWTKIDLFNLSPEQDLTMVSAAPVLCWRLLALR